MQAVIICRGAGGFIILAVAGVITSLLSGFRAGVLLEVLRWHQSLGLRCGDLFLQNGYGADHMKTGDRLVEENEMALLSVIRERYLW